MNRLIIAALLSGLIVFSSLPAAAQQGNGQRAVLVTGASSGIGRNVAERLASEGFFVYAGARKDKDLAELDALENMQAVRLDVTVQDDIDAAVQTVEAGGKGLYGLVNNAGVARLGPLTQVPESDLDFMFGVNVYGPYRVTKAFAPLIIEQQGRVTTTGSISGFIARADSGVYSMSKFAMEAYTDALAEELEPQGVKVSIVEPGSFKSDIWRKMTEHGLEQADQSGAEVTEEMRARALDLRNFGEGQPEPDAVSAAVLHALSSDAPKRRYMVTPNQEQAEATLREAFRRIAELNDGHEFSYTHDELAQMLFQSLTVD